MPQAMSLEPALPGMFAPQQGALPLVAPEPATQKQVTFAMSIARKTGRPIPRATLRDRKALSGWIDRNKPKPIEGRFALYPSGKQVAFAERIATVKRCEVPPECFKDKTLMSKWIDGNKPR